MPDTFYWHDYETFGADPSRDRPAQFAGLRTDMELNPVGGPLVLYARPADDFLPHPQSCLITGITPRKALAQGIPECEFIARILDELARPGTCGAGYNSLRFDDEITRYTLYRNFHDPYAREYKHGNSRWDIIDLLRTARALRPEGIEWPVRDDGLPSFRLEDLTAANGIRHASAHDALSDVEATIAMARLVRERQPRLYDYVLRHRDKRAVLQQLDISAMKPVLHVSGMFGAARHNIALVAPLAVHPVNRNEIICYDLSADPAPLLQLPPERIRELLYTPAGALGAGEQRPGLKSVHANRCPVLVTARMADPETAERLGLDGARCRAHLAELRRYRDSDPRGFTARIQAVYEGREFEPETDPDRMLYGGGFFSDSDRRLMERIHRTPPLELAALQLPFEDPRLPEMLFRYRARNHPDTLSAAERARWDEFRFRRLTEPDAGASICLEEYQALIEAQLAEPGLPARDRAILQQLLEYGDTLLA